MVQQALNNAFVVFFTQSQSYMHGKLCQFSTSFASIQCGTHMQMLSFSFFQLHHKTQDNSPFHRSQSDKKMPVDVYQGSSEPTGARATSGFFVAKQENDSRLPAYLFEKKEKRKGVLLFHMQSCCFLYLNPTFLSSPTKITNICIFLL